MSKDHLTIKDNTRYNNNVLGATPLIAFAPPPRTAPYIRLAPFREVSLRSGQYYRQSYKHSLILSLHPN